MTITDRTTGESVGLTYTYGSSTGGTHTATCPLERFQNFSPGVYAVTNHAYTINVATTTRTPGNYIIRLGSESADVTWR